MNKQLKKLGFITGLAGIVSACSIDRNPMGIYGEDRPFVVTNTYLPSLRSCARIEVYSTRGDTIYVSDDTKDTRGGLHPGVDTIPDASQKYQCPVIGFPSVPVGYVYKVRIDSARGPNAAEINVFRRTSFDIEEYPKYVEVNGQPISGLTYPQAGLNVQEGTYIEDIEHIDPTAPANIRNSNAVKFLVGNGSGEWGVGPEGLIDRGLMRVRVVPCGVNGQPGPAGTSELSREWYVPTSAIAKDTGYYKALGRH